MYKPPETPPPSAAFSFKVKSLLLEMFARTTKIGGCLNQLEQGEEAFATESAEDTLTALEAEAKEFHALSSINLPTLSWLAASRQLTDREALAVIDIKKRVKALADRISKEPLQSRRDAKAAFEYIGWVAWNLEAIKTTMQREEEIALSDDNQRKEENKRHSRNQILLAITISIISASIGVILGLLGERFL